MTTEVSVTRAEGAEPSVFYSSAQTTNGLCDITALRSRLGAAVNQGPPAQWPQPPPRSSVLGEKHYQEVWGPPVPGLLSSPAVSTKPGLARM